MTWDQMLANIRQIMMENGLGQSTEKPEVCRDIQTIQGRGLVLALVAILVMVLVFYFLAWSVRYHRKKKKEKPAADEKAKPETPETKATETNDALATSTEPAPPAPAPVEEEPSPPLPRTPFLLGTLIWLAGFYAVGRLFDLLISLQDIPYWDSSESVIEETLLGSTPLGSFLPLFYYPYLGMVVHAILWTLLLLMGYFIQHRFAKAAGVKVSSERYLVPRSFRISGCSTTKGLDLQHRTWLLPLSKAILVFAGLAFLLQPAVTSHSQFAKSCLGGLWNVPATFIVSPGVIILSILFGLVLYLHCKFQAHDPTTSEKKEENSEGAKKIDVLKVLREELEKIHSGNQIDDDLIEIPHIQGASADWPAGIPVLLKETQKQFSTEEAGLYLTQAKMVETLHQALALQGKQVVYSDDLQSDIGVSNPQVIKKQKFDCLVLAGPEGSGRKTTQILLSILSHLERGGTTLYLFRHRQRMQAVYQVFQQFVNSSSLRWSIESVLAGDTLEDAVAARKVPAVVFGDLKSMEEDLLVSTRFDRILQSTHLVLIDEVHEFTGVLEMHLSMVLQRLWLTFEHIGRANSLPIVVASMGPSFEESGAWASSILGRRAEVVGFRGPDVPRRLMIRRRHLHADVGELALSDIARACENGKIHWHLRMSGDGMRDINRLDGELKALSRYRVDSPDRAGVVLLEGSFGEVQREVEMTSLCSARSSFGYGVQIAAPLVEEERIFEPLGTSLPWMAIPLTTSTEVRTNHAMRASLARAYQESRFVDRLLGLAGKEQYNGWVEHGVLDTVPHRELPESSYQPAVVNRVFRAPSAPPVPPLYHYCATSQRARMINAQVGETLEWTDACVAPAMYYPGAVRLLSSGRYRLATQADKWCPSGPGEAAYGASGVEAAIRSIGERTWSLDEKSIWTLATADRTFGKKTIRCRSGSIGTRQHIQRVRTYTADKKLQDAREIPFQVEVDYETRVFLLSTEFTHEELKILRPVVSTLAMVAHSTIRTGRHLLWVGVFEMAEKLHIGFIDKTPGGNGISSTLDDSLLVTLLKTASAALEQLSERDADRLRDLYDQTVDASSQSWDLPAAKKWLSEIVNPLETGGKIEDLPAPAFDASMAQRVEKVFPAFSWYPESEKSLFLDTVRGFFESLPMKAQGGANVRDEDRLCVAAGMAAVFYRRPDLRIPSGFYIVFDSGDECRNVPGAAGYCQSGKNCHICLALGSLRKSIELDGYALVPHEAAHLFDALDGTSDGMLSGLSGKEKTSWLKAAAQEIPKARSGQSMLSEYAGTSPEEFVAESVAAFVELPIELHQKLPVIYNCLRSALRQDTAKWKKSKPEPK